MNFIKEMFSESNGKISGSRIMAAAIISVVLFNWTYFNITQGVFVPLNLGEGLMVVGALATKAYQRGQEK